MNNIIYLKNPTNAHIEILAEGLAQNAKQKRGLEPAEEFIFFVTDEKNNKLGGCYGVIYYGCICVYKLWIDPKFRSHGYATKLMQQAEEFGRSKRCSFFTVSTMDWEALDFYKGLGFSVEFERRGYANKSILYELRKEL